MKDISGKRFGRLLAMEYDHSANHKRFWRCACDCGKVTVIRQDQITTGKTRSCGCYLKETQVSNLNKGRIKKPKKQKQRDAQQTNRIDGHYKTWNPIKHKYPRIYRIWQSMKSRCYYKNNKCYSCYGGRGISICSEWISDFNTFANWALTHGYKDNLSIDRIDVNGNYEPGNCRWVTMAEQQKNKRKRPSRIA